MFHRLLLEIARTWPSEMKLKKWRPPI